MRHIHTVIKTLINHWKVAILILGMTPLCMGQGQRPTLKVGVYYTAKAESMLLPNTLKDREQKVEEILQSINSDLDLNYDVAFFNTRLKYKEPNQRSNDYIDYEMHGTSQIMQEMMNHQRLMIYNELGGQLPLEGSTLDENELDENFIGLDVMALSDINIILVHEEGQRMLLSQNTLQVAEYANATDVDVPMYAVISADELTANDYALAVAIFSLMADPNEATYELDSRGNKINYSLLGYWIEEGRNEEVFNPASSGSLSLDNMNLFQCNMAKLNIESPESNIIRGEKVSNAKTQTIVDAKNWISIQPGTDISGNSASTSSVILTVDANDNTSYISFTTGEYTTGSSQECPYTPPAPPSGRTAQELQNEELDQPEEVHQLNEFLLVYPNPFTNELNISFESDGLSSADLRIYDMGGRVIDQESYSLDTSSNAHEIKYDGSRLFPGMYIYRLIIGDRIKSGKISKKF